jgi:transcriptional regulator with XRE-family HTH domain
LLWCGGFEGLPCSCCHACASEGATLRDLRELKGKTQVEIGKALGVSQVQAGRIEKGGEEIQLSTLRRYLDALGLELEGVQVRDRARDYLVVLVQLGEVEKKKPTRRTKR